MFASASSSSSSSSYSHPSAPFMPFGTTPTAAPTPRRLPIFGNPDFYTAFRPFGIRASPSPSPAPATTTTTSSSFPAGAPFSTPTTNYPASASPPRTPSLSPISLPAASPASTPETDVSLPLIHIPRTELELVHVPPPATHAFWMLVRGVEGYYWVEGPEVGKEAKAGAQGGGGAEQGQKRKRGSDQAFEHEDGAGAAKRACY